MKKHKTGVIAELSFFGFILLNIYGYFVLVSVLRGHEIIWSLKTMWGLMMFISILAVASSIGWGLFTLVTRTLTSSIFGIGKGGGGRENQFDKLSRKIAKEHNKMAAKEANRVVVEKAQKDEWEKFNQNMDNLRKK